MSKGAWWESAAKQVRKKSQSRLVSPLEVMTEKELRQSIVAVAKDLGWLCSFAWTSIHSPRGLPDLTLCHLLRHELLFWELKSVRGKVTPAQQEWLDALAAVPGVEARVIRPDDLEWAYKRLAGVLPAGCGTPPGRGTCTDGTPIHAGEAALRPGRP